MALGIDGPAFPFLTMTYLHISNEELSRGSLIVSDKKTHGKTSGIQGKILSTSSD
jgi:hypothetical protein